MALHAAVGETGTACVCGRQQSFGAVTDLLRHLDLDLWVVGIGVQHDD